MHYSFFRKTLFTFALFGLAGCSEAPNDPQAAAKPLPKAQVVIVERGMLAATFLAIFFVPLFYALVRQWFPHKPRTEL